MGVPVASIGRKEGLNIVIQIVGSTDTNNNLTGKIGQGRSQILIFRLVSQMETGICRDCNPRE